jgi:catechol 2,3-dioxygenase-like lactoylglutathione lyase family enzyme
LYRYIDYNLTYPGESYWGLENAKALSDLLAEVDPEGVLATPASRYLYSYEEKEVDSEGDTCDEVDPEGDTCEEVNPEGDTCEEVDPEGDTCEEVDPEGDTPARGGHCLFSHL